MADLAILADIIEAQAWLTALTNHIAAEAAHGASARVTGTDETVSVDGEAVLFDGADGNKLKRSDKTGVIKETAGVASVATAADIPSELEFNSQTGTTYALAIADAHRLTTCANANPVTVTIQPFATVAIPTKSQCPVIQYGAGQVSFTAGVGVTILGDTKITGQYKGCVAIHTDVLNTWLLVGSLES